MADRLKGIVVEIGAETQGLDKALKDVNNTSRDLQKELSDVQRLLKFNPNSAELIAQKQKLLTDQVANTTEKLDQLKAAQAQVQAQFERGDIGAEQYRAFQREVLATEGRLKFFQNSLQDVEQEQTDVAESSKQLQRLFEATNSTVDDYADTLGTKLTRAIQDGTATSKDLERAFELVGKEALGTQTDINEVREAIKKIDSGEASIKNVRKELQKMSEDAQDAQGSVKDLGGELGGIAAGVAGGLGLDAVIEKAMSQAQQEAIIDVTLDLDEEGTQSVKNAINSIQAYGVEGEEALEAVRKQWALNADASDASNQETIKQAGAISAAYGNIDLQELIQESSEIGGELGISQQQALGLTNALLKAGFPDDQLDIIAEYGSQLSRAGYSAEEIQGIFAAGVKTDTWNIDVLLDGLKEGRIGLAEMGTGVDDATAKIIEGTGISSTQLQTWGSAVAEGGEAGKTAMMEVALALSTIEDGTKRNEVGTKLFGTLWEEQGSKITDTLLGASEHTGNLATNQEELNGMVATMDSTPAAQLNTAMSTLWTTMQPLLEHVANLITKITEWVQKNPELTAGIAALVIGIGIMIGIFTILAPIITALIGLSGTLGITIGAMVAPILIAIAIIAAIIAIGVLLYKNWDTIVAKAKELAANIKQRFEEFKNAATTKIEEAKTKIETTWNKVMQFFRDIDLKKIGKDIIQGLINGIGSMAKKVKDKAAEVANGIGEKIKSILKLGSPSKVMIKMGQDTGSGLAIGLSDSVSEVSNASSNLANTITSEFSKFASQVQVSDPIKKYFTAIQEDGDWLNDWLTHMPKQIRSTIQEMGKMLAPQLEGAEGLTIEDDVARIRTKNNTLTVNLNSPKALDVREANKAFNRTLNKMSLMW